MFQNVMIQRLFGFVNDQKENKSDYFEDAVFLLLKIENFDSFMKRYKLLYPKISFGLGFLKAEEGALRLFSFEELVKGKLELEIGLLGKGEKLNFFGFHLFAAQYVHSSYACYIYFINWKGQLN
jgi:hypothetical protein